MKLRRGAGLSKSVTSGTCHFWSLDPVPPLVFMHIWKYHMWYGSLESVIHLFFEVFRYPQKHWLEQGSWVIMFGMYNVSNLFENCLAFQHKEIIPF